MPINKERCISAALRFTRTNARGETQTQTHTYTRVRTAREDHNYIFIQDKRPRQVDTYANVFWYLSCVSNKLCNNQIPFFWHWHAPPFWKWFFLLVISFLCQTEILTPDPIQVQSYRCVGIYSIIEWNGMDSDWIFNNHVLTRTDSRLTTIRWRCYAIFLRKQMSHQQTIPMNLLLKRMKWKVHHERALYLPLFLSFTFPLHEWSSFEYLDAHEFGFWSNKQKK